MSETDTTPGMAPVDELKFGVALEELETIVAALESGALDLEDSLSRYERGVVLLKALQTRLGEAQQKVTVLLGELESDAEEPEDGGEA
ncbi:MAG: exodeoxyribonuclease VII small subunit [Coriobacteriia bacterium]|nr:exodeoxyribonuclease VII small subunit [Coriobacteriia bacterium]